MAQQSRVEVCRLDGLWVVSPSLNVGVGERRLERDVVLLLPLLELLWQRSVTSRLHLLDLIPVEGSIIEHLPLLRLAFVRFDLHLLDALLANDVLNPVLELDKSRLSASIVLKAC